MKISYLSLIALTALLGACMVSEPIVQKGASVEKVQEGKTYDDYAVNYALPRTVVNVKVVAEKTVIKPGPFAAYAERFLGIASVPTREASEWKIKGISLSTSGQRDPEQVYRISSKGVSKADRIQLNYEGVILGVNMPPFENATYDLSKVRLNTTGDMVIPGYPDLSIRKHTEPMLDTVFQTLRTDTSFIRLPLLKEQISTKTLMNQAEEAANIIMTLRERKYWLINGEFVIEEGLIPLPDGPGLDIMIREMEELEYDYVSLFVGRTVTESKTYEFSYIPVSEGGKDYHDLFSFSSFSGILPSGSSNGVPVKLVMSAIPAYSGQPDKIEIDQKETEAKRGALAYRIPGMAEISVEKEGEILVSESFLVAQYGIVQFLPQNLLSQPDIMIRMHPDLGSIEGIYEK